MPLNLSIVIGRYRRYSAIRLRVYQRGWSRIRCSLVIGKRGPTRGWAFQPSSSSLEYTWLDQGYRRVDLVIGRYEALCRGETRAIELEI